MRNGIGNTFATNLSESQKRLCAWVALQTRFGAGKVLYEDAKPAVGIPTDVELTDTLRQIRERSDPVHEMVRSPITHTRKPYFEISPAANCIWTDYCRNQVSDDLEFEEPDVFASANREESCCAVCTA